MENKMGGEFAYVNSIFKYTRAIGLGRVTRTLSYFDPIPDPRNFLFQNSTWNPICILQKKVRKI